MDYDDSRTQTYAFDPMGDRTQKADSVTGTENYNYNNANMLLTRGSNSYTNDLNGNTLTSGGRTNTWDQQDRLTQVSGGGITTNYVYGSDGLRRRSTVSSTSTDYILDGSSVVRERQGGTNIATYLHGPRGPEYRRNDSTGTVRWYLYDGLGSVLGEVDTTGTITTSRKYDVYGSVRDSTGISTSKHKFVGGLGHPSEDETGLIYMRARWYDPVAGRFVNEDPKGAGTNWFSYCDSNPVCFVDARGTDKNGYDDWIKNHIKSSGDYTLGLTLSAIAFTLGRVAARTGNPTLMKAAIVSAVAAAIFMACALGGTTAEIQAGIVQNAGGLAIGVYIASLISPTSGLAMLDFSNGMSGWIAGLAAMEVFTYGIQLISALILT